MATTSNTITATAGQTEFSFSFPYLKKESIKVTIDTVVTTAFTIPDNNPTTVILNSGATAGQVIKISRLTSTTATPSTFFSGGAIRSQDLNNNFDSILYITQEKENQLTEVIAGGIADASITSDKLANNSVGTAALIDGSVATVDLANDAVTTAKIVNDAVTTAKILDANVTTAKIATNAVTTAKILDANVTTAKIADANVTTAKLADSNVTTAKLADSNVTTVKLADSNVTTAKIADDAVTVAKLDPAIIFVPTGAITAFGGSTAPTGYLECNGQSTAGYAALAAVVGANVPDLRGEFVRGWDDGRGVDTGRTLGSTQDHQFQDHKHTYNYWGAGSFGNANAAQRADTATSGLTTNNASTGNRGAETRPRNVALMYIIKT
tara:strand:- start:244 stop:1386 length:1143 start_codon:yes stop_codon:yes gene_type:complete